MSDASSEPGWSTDARYSRILSSKAEGESQLQIAPVADEIVRDESYPDIEWTALKADFTAKRVVARHSTFM